MKRSPVEVYAVALDLLRYPRKTLPETIVQGVEDIARSAARHSLRGPPLGDWTPKMKVKSDDYTQLINYHRQCTLRVLKFVATGDLIKRTGTEWIWHNPRCEACPPTSKVPVVALGIPKHPTSWWVIFWERVVASIGECPCEELLEDGQIWNSTLQALAKECPTCYQTAVEKYPRFKEKVMQIITDIIDSVSIYLSVGLPVKV